MYNKAISRKIYDLLQDHVSEIEKAEEKLVRASLIENLEESNKIRAFFREYTAELRNYLDGAQIGKNTDEGLPFTIIGSVVEVQDTEDMDTFKYRLVLPYAENMSQSFDCASCMSPLGKALLLKSEGQKINVEIPTGSLLYLIKGISLPEQYQDLDCGGQKLMA